LFVTLTLKIISNAAKNFDILATLSVLHNYFKFNKITFDLYPAKILAQNCSFRVKKNRKIERKISNRY